jgi:hypothetical protein
MKTFSRTILTCLVNLLILTNTGAQEKLLIYPDQWQFEIRSSYIILTSDQQLIDLQDPDKQIELTLTTEPVWGSLRMICDTARARGATTLKLAFDNFFHQYREEGDPEILHQMTTSS